jgi:hypothetical protein
MLSGYAHKLRVSFLSGQHKRAAFFYAVVPVRVRLSPVIQLNFVTFKFQVLCEPVEQPTGTVVKLVNAGQKVNSDFVSSFPSFG